LGGYYRIPADNRDLNYSLYFSKGEQKIAMLEDYNSSNTQRLDLDAMVELLLTVEVVRDELKGWGK